MSIFLVVNRLLCLVFCLQQMEDPVCLAVCVPIWMLWASEDCQVGVESLVLSCTSQEERNPRALQYICITDFSRLHLNIGILCWAVDAVGEWRLPVGGLGPILYQPGGALDYTWISASFTCPQRQQIGNAMNTCIWQLLLSPLSAYMHAVMVIFINTNKTKHLVSYMVRSLCACLYRWS